MRIFLLCVAGCSATSSFGYLNPPLGNDGRLGATGMGILGPQLASALRSTYRGQLEKAEPPISLVPTDGSELALTALDAQVAIDGPIAHTELHFTFHNAEARLREGRFSVSLPPDAAVDRFAMKVNGAWREARIVARQQGREVYERFLKQRVDPALLERDAGNTFSARIYPIPASADKEIIIAYDHLVSAQHPYELALAGLPVIPRLAIAVDHDGAHRDVRGDGRAPADLTEAIAPGSVVRISGEAFVARLEPPATGTKVTLDQVAILVDTSASRATVMGRQAHAVEQLVRSLPAAAEIVIAAYDQDVVELYRGSAGAFPGTGDLLARGALGASDLGAALRFAKATAMPRVILVGDGTPTLGETDAGKLAALVHGIDRLDAIQVGTSIDRDTLGAVTRAGVNPGGLYDARDPLLARLEAAPRPVEALAVAVATQVWPPTTKGLAPGEPVWVFGKRASIDGFTAFVGGRPLALAPATGKRVGRIVARAEVVALTEARTSAKDPRVIDTQIERLGLANNLVTPLTSLLVLESDADEQRMLGSVRTASDPDQVQPAAGGETIVVHGAAPTIDATSTHQGITITREYVRNIPVPGRTFTAALGAVAGSQGDTVGTTFSGSSSLENQYYVDGVNTTTVTYGAVARRTGALRMGDDFGGFDGIPAPAGDLPASAKDGHAPPYSGTMLEVLRSISVGDTGRALAVAAKAELANPGDVASLLALGEALEARGATQLAARAYGSLIDLYPSRAELVRAAGERLDRLGAAARPLAIDAYRRAIRERADQVGEYRLLALDLLRDGDAAGALATLDLLTGKAMRGSIALILTRDRQQIAATIAHDHPERANALAARYGALPTEPSVRFVLAWETDANDVDLHVYDRAGAHAFFGARHLPSGGDLLDDVTDGYGPEMFVAEKPTGFPYHLAVHYYNRGPEGVGLGSVQVLRFAGGKLSVEDRPFVIQNDNAMVDLGVVP